MIVPLALACAVIGADEARYYTNELIPVPDGEVIEVGGIAFPQDDVIAVSTRRGRVWLIDGALDDDVSDSRWTIFVEGLNEGLGMDIDGDDLVVLQRTELSRLRDVDGDRRVDDIDVITQGWGITDNYHEFAFGLPRDAQGNRWLSLNLAFLSPEWWHGQSLEPYRGWVLRVAPDGEVTPWATGFRSPCGVGIDAQDRVLITDNQGDWVPSSPIYVVDRDAFHGHPAGLRWTEEWLRDGLVGNDRNPPEVERNPAAIWIPYEWSRSTGNLVPDMTGGAFGPFERQLFVAELTTGRILRAEIEEIDGVEQGAVWKFLDRVGSAARVAFAPDDSLIVGLTNRGWGGRTPGHGVARIRWTGEVPMEMAHMRLVPGGFDIEFTRSIVGQVSADQIVAESYDYNWWWKYGSPEQRRRKLDIDGVRTSSDGRTLHVRIGDLRAGRVVRMRLDGIVAADGHELLHDEVAYTINRLPGGPTMPVAKEVDPPPEDSDDHDESGWVRLTWDDPRDLWTGNWRLARDELDPDDPTRFTSEDGTDALVNDAPSSGEYVFNSVMPDGRVTMRVMAAQGGGLAMGLPGDARLVLRDQGGSGSIEVRSADGLVLAATDRDLWRGPGQWYDLMLEVRDGVLERVQVDDVTVIEDVDLPEGPARRWLRFLPEPTGGAIADIRIEPDNDQPADQGEDFLREVHGLLGESGGGIGPEGLVLQGGPGGVDLRDRPVQFTLHASLEFTPGTTATLHLGDNGPAIAIAEGTGDAATTGSILGRDERSVMLVAPDSVHDLSVEVLRDGTDDRVSVALNGLDVAEATWPTASGTISISIDNGELQVYSLDVVPLDP